MIKLNKRVISLLLGGTLLCGCTNNTDTNSPVSEPIKKGLHVEEVDVKDNNPIYIVRNNKVDYYTSLDLEGYITSSYIPFDYKNSCTPSEFGSYIKEYSITYNDVRNSLNSNTNIDDNIKSILFEGINNLEKNNFNINLSVLNYNLRDLRIEYVKKGNVESGEIYAKYEPNGNVLYFNPDKVNDPLFNDILIHEVLGHASNLAYLPSKDLYCSTTISTIIVEDGKIIGNNVLGRAYEEAIAEYIRYLATDKKISVSDSSYTIPLYFLLIMCNTNDITVEDYINKGVLYLIDRQELNDMGIVSNVNEMIDVKFNYITLLNSNLSYEFNDLLFEYLEAYTNHLMLRNYSKEDIIMQINNIIDIHNKYIVSATDSGYKLIYLASSNDNVSFLVYNKVKEEIDNYIDAIYGREMTK